MTRRRDLVVARGRSLGRAGRRGPQGPGRRAGRRDRVLRGPEPLPGAADRRRPAVLPRGARRAPRWPRAPRTASPTRSRWCSPSAASRCSTRCEAVFDGEYGGLLTVASLGALVTLSGAWAVVVQALNLAYDSDEHRPWLRRRLLGLGLGLMTVAGRGGRAGRRRGRPAAGPRLRRGRRRRSGRRLRDVLGPGPPAAAGPGARRLAGAGLPPGTQPAYAVARRAARRGRPPPCCGWPPAPASASTCAPSARATRCSASSAAASWC